MNKINLVYYKGIINFGDLLSPFIISKLSGKDIIFKEFYKGFKLSFIDFLHAIHHWDFNYLNNKILPWQNNLIAVGSILNAGNSRSKIWGAGFLDSKDQFRGGKIYALRGPYSNKIIKEMGYKGCNIFGDPALLLPIILPLKNSHNKFLGIIPHWRDYDKMINNSLIKYDIINLKTTDIIEKIKEITSYSYILSTSLHGIIVAHAYGIPAIWIKQNKIDGDDIKFKDYFSSVEIPLYEGFKNWEEIILSPRSIESFFNSNKNIALPNTDITIIQKNLLRVAPFKLLTQYKNF